MGSNFCGPLWKKTTNSKFLTIGTLDLSSYLVVVLNFFFHIYWLPIYVVKLGSERVNLLVQNAFQSMMHNKAILVLALFKSSVSMLTSSLLSTLTWIATPSLSANGFALMEQWVNYIAGKVHAKQQKIRASTAVYLNFCTVWTVIFSFYLFTFLNILSNRFSIIFFISFKYYFFIHSLFFF